MAKTDDTIGGFLELTWTGYLINIFSFYLLLDVRLLQVKAYNLESLKLSILKTLNLSFKMDLYR